jgi:endoglucanase
MNLLLSTSMILLLLVVSKASAEFFRTAGRNILDPQGEVFISKGINLNGWLLPEAYGMRIDTVHDRHMNAMSDIEEQIQTLLGGSEEDAAEFWDAFIANHVTEQDIMDLADLGFNAIRLPFNFRLVSPLNTPGEYSEEGFQMLDMVISWCRSAGLALLLDMHACPGGQSHGTYKFLEIILFSTRSCDIVSLLLPTNLLLPSSCY